MTPKRYIGFMALAFLLIFAITLIGCEKEENGTQIGTSISKSELIEKVTALGQGLKTAEIDGDMIMEMSGTDEDGQRMDMTMSMTMSGAMDIPNRNMRMAMDIEMDLPDEAGAFGALLGDSIEMEMYLIGDMMYMNMGEMFGTDGGWMKMRLSADEYGSYWEQQDWLGQQTDLLLDAFDVEILGKGKVNGIDCYEIRINPDMEQLFEIMIQDGLMGSGEVDPLDMEEATDAITDFSVKQWYAVDTFLPIKSEMHMAMVDEETGADIDMNMVMNMKYSKVNEPVTIVLPPEAKEAVDMSDMMDFELE